MLKRLHRFLVRVFEVIGAERIALKFALLSLDDVAVEVPITETKNFPSVIENFTNMWDPKVVYEDKELILQLGIPNTIDITLPKNFLDVN